MRYLPLILLLGCTPAAKPEPKPMPRSEMERHWRDNGYTQEDLEEAERHMHDQDAAYRSEWWGD